MTSLSFTNNYCLFTSADCRDEMCDDRNCTDKERNATITALSIFLAIFILISIGLSGGLMYMWRNCERKRDDTDQSRPLNSKKGKEIEEDRKKGTNQEDDKTPLGQPVADDTEEVHENETNNAQKV